MNRYRLTQSGGRTFIERVLDPPRPYQQVRFVTAYGEHVFGQGAGNHRKGYTEADAMAVVRWLNERKNGYPSLNYLAQHWAIQDGRAAPVVRK